MGFRDWFDRIPSANEKIVARGIEDPIKGWGLHSGALAGRAKAEQFAIDGGQAQFLKLAHQITATGVYPGGGTLGTSPATAGGTTLVLPATILQSKNSNLTPVGMLVLITSNVGGALGEVRLITGWNSSTGTITVERAWLTGRVPANTDTFELLVPAYPNAVLLKTEYSANTNTHSGSLLFYDWPLTFDPTPAYRGALVMPDSKVTIANKAITTKAADSGYYHGNPLVVDARGFMGWQFNVEAISAGAVSLWGAAK